MSAMTFDEAVAAPGRIVQVWDGGVKDGQRMLMIYRLADSGPEQLAWRAVPVEEHDSVAVDLAARGLVVADTEASCDFIWIATPDRVEVYGRRSRELDASGDRAVLAIGRVVARADIARIVAFADDDLVWRGVKAELHSGQDIPLVTEASMAAEAGAGYSRNDLLMETGWASTLGVAIARWAGVSFENRI
jgi:hypothetical protein